MDNKQMLLAMAEALDCFWNEAIGSAQNHGDSSTIAMAGALAEGFSAVAARLRDEVEALPVAAQQPCAWVVKLRYSNGDGGAVRWSGEMLTDVLPSDTYSYRVIRPLYAAPATSEDDIKHMVARFLQWRLPADFSPDGGVSFERQYNQATGSPAEPVGTNLLNATQAEAMVRHMVSKAQEGEPA